MQIISKYLNIIDAEADLLVDAGQNVTDAGTDLVLIPSDLPNLLDDDAVQSTGKEGKRFRALNAANKKSNKEKLKKLRKRKLNTTRIPLIQTTIGFFGLSGQGRVDPLVLDSLVRTNQIDLTLKGG